MWRGAQDQKIRQANSTSNTKDKNEPNDAEGVTLPRIVVLVELFLVSSSRFAVDLRPFLKSSL
jgi:hypothetical protein